MVAGDGALIVVKVRSDLRKLNGSLASYPMKRLVPFLALAPVSLLFVLGVEAQPAASKPAAPAVASSGGASAEDLRRLAPSASDQVT
jgi:hypothetical protein